MERFALIFEQQVESIPDVRLQLGQSVSLAEDARGFSQPPDEAAVVRPVLQGVGLRHGGPSGREFKLVHPPSCSRTASPAAASAAGRFSGCWPPAWAKSARPPPRPPTRPESFLTRSPARTLSTRSGVTAAIRLTLPSPRLPSTTTPEPSFARN